MMSFCEGHLDIDICLADKIHTHVSKFKGDDI